MSTLSTHVLDTSIGRPAEGVRVTLIANGREIGSAATDANGRAVNLGDGTLAEGEYTLRFSVADYFARSGRETFYRDVEVAFRIGGADEHYHVPLLLNPFGYSTYRGS